MKEVVLQKKLDYLNRFLTLKKKRQATTFTRMALEQIEASTSSGTGNQLNLTAVSEKNLLSGDSLQGLWQTLNALFGHQGIPYDTANWSGENYLSYLDDPNQISTNTQFDRDTLLSRIKEILAQTGDIELQMQQSLTQRPALVLHWAKWRWISPRRWPRPRTRPSSRC